MYVYVCVKEATPRPPGLGMGVGDSGKRLLAQVATQLAITMRTHTADHQEMRIFLESFRVQVGGYRVQFGGFGGLFGPYFGSCRAPVGVWETQRPQGRGLEGLWSAQGRLGTRK